MLLVIIPPCRSMLRYHDEGISVNRSAAYTFVVLHSVSGFFQASAQMPPRGICSDVTLPYLILLLYYSDLTR